MCSGVILEVAGQMGEPLRPFALVGVWMVVGIADVVRQDPDGKTVE